MAKALPVDADGNPVYLTPEELNPGAAPGSLHSGDSKDLSWTPPIGGVPETDPTATPQWETGAQQVDAPAETPAPRSGGGGGGGVEQALGSPTSTPTQAPGSPDNSQLNALLSQLLEGQKGRDQLSAQQYADQQKFRQNIIDTVNGIIGRNTGVASAEDPVIASQVTAFKGQGEQALRQAREAQAARARAEGSSTGALDSSVAGGFNALGKNTGAFSAGLVGSENNARRSALQGAAQIGAGVIGQDQNTALQDKISTLDSALKASQIQGGQAIDWATLLQKPLLASISAGPGNASAGAQWAGVNNQNQQFYDKFTYDQATNDNMTNLLAQLLLQGA